MSSEELAGAGIAEPGTGGLTGGDIADLRGALRGPVLESADHGFDDVRAIWNGMIDRRPAAIARCLDGRRRGGDAWGGAANGSGRVGARR